ncbi:energy-coupling factor transporter ATPase [Helcococcus ovis]|uniref:Energy-coupling factor transporter ATP-binding protein EcfA2 n=1 Tax=Helcococcus ovis TaxID=72026 RepID=A0A4R9C2K5_9FIRM|nr:energy-coupling factor transporter ATPase [Helcococcus ovis]TFF66245.1 energy-coupling factor transporter ATPase [Helcococcus ovis]TFF67276.1 energy-coupling factor transporter ATPase [Helcococcus ovis]TFF68322.1 energy-coupling factor transporter ATPase [Helcococcus ovis]WNZ00927.1 energy-coupling factor transporter ATPase [Helcococcus ovis]
MSIELKNVKYKYNSSDDKYALDDVNLKINKNEFIGVIGHTGSGKSTMVQLFNGLIYPTEGTVNVDGEDVSESNKSNLKQVRQKVGLVFQYPEYQLFEETIALDIAFGPKNLNLPEEEVQKRVKESMKLVGLDYEKYKDESPFDLSGGQKRRVAIASILAMQPRYLILDEPTAGLDPQGRDEILGELRKIYESDDELTVVVVSHSMEDIAKIADRVIVMSDGKVFDDNIPEIIYSNGEKLENIGLDIPQITKVTSLLKDKGYNFDKTIINVKDAYEILLKQLGGKDE